MRRQVVRKREEVSQKEEHPRQREQPGQRSDMLDMFECRSQRGDRRGGLPEAVDSCKFLSSQ